MLFPSATIGDLQVRLLLIRPDLSGGRAIEVQHRFDTIIAEGRTTIEERMAARAALLLSQRCTLTLLGNAADDWRKGLAALGPRPIGVPMWIDALPVSRWDERIYEPQKVLNFDSESGDFQIYDLADVPDEPDHPLLAPLMIGRWSERPEAATLQGTVGVVDVAISEASPYSCRIGINTQAGGWTAMPDRALGPVKDRSEYGLELVTTGGAVREPGLDRESAAARWRQEGQFTFRTRAEIRQHLSHFVAQKGSLSTWSPVPAFFQPGADTAETPDSYTARFAEDALTLNYLSGKVARATVGFVQEIDTAERSQALASETYLYTWTYQHDADNPELATNWDAPLTAAEGDFEPTQCAHKEIILSLRPQDVKADLEVAFVPGSLMADWMLGRLFGWVKVQIEKVDPANIASTRTTIFTGRVRRVVPSGNRLQVTATLFGRTLEKRIPSDLFSPNCNALVFDERCGLVEADHDSTGTIEPADLAADRMTLTVHSPSGWEGPTYVENFFGPNGILRTGTGRNTMVATIVSSTMSGSDLVVKVNRPLWADMIDGGGQSVTLVPGCGGQIDTDCDTKFDNRANHRGFHFMPDYIEQSMPGMATKVKK